MPTKVHLVKAMVFPVVIYECESWTTKKTEHQRTDTFELWCWRRFLNQKAGGEGTTEDKMVGYHHLLNGHESEQAPGDEQQKTSDC